MRNPIWFTRAGHNACRAGHEPRNSGTSVRGNAVVFNACQRAECGRCAIGIQSTELDLTIWFEVSRDRYKLLATTDTTTPALRLLALAGYHEMPDAAPTPA